MSFEPFSIAVDRKRRRIDFTFRGFWTLRTFAEYEAASFAAFRTLHWQGSDHTVLADLSEFAIQSQDVFAAMTRMLEDDPHPPRRFALVGGTGLAQMQFRRAIRGDGMRLFAARAEAEVWLDEDRRDARRVA